MIVVGDRVTCDDYPRVLGYVTAETRDDGRVYVDWSANGKSILRWTPAHRLTLWRQV